MNVQEIFESMVGLPEYYDRYKTLGADFEKSVKACAIMALREALADERIAKEILKRKSTLTTVAGTTTYEFGGSLEDDGTTYKHDAIKILSIFPQQTTNVGKPKPLDEYSGPESWAYASKATGLTLLQMQTSDPSGFYPRGYTIDENRDPIIELVPGVNAVKTYDVWYVQKYSKQSPEFSLIDDIWNAHFRIGTASYLELRDQNARQLWEQKLNEMRNAISPVDNIPEQENHPEIEEQNLWRNKQAGSELSV